MKEHWLEGFYNEGIQNKTGEIQFEDKYSIHEINRKDEV